MSKHFNIILSNAPVKNGNRGCVALSYTSMMIISELLEKNGVGYNFYLCDSGFFDRKSHAIKIGSKELEFFDVGKPFGSTLKEKILLLAKYNKSKYDKRIFKDADYILDVGQGDSFADIYGKNRFELIFKSYMLSDKYNLPLCILPQTIGPFENASIRKRALKGIDSARCVLVRDKQSYSFTKKLLPHKDICEIIDVAFFMPYIKKKFSDNFVHVGINISSLLWKGGYTQDNQFGLKADYPKLIRRVIEYFLNLPSIQVHLIPHVVDAEVGIENDYEVSYNLYEEYQNERLTLAPFFLDPITAKSYIAGMDFFMGARMHSTIAAFSSNVPVIPMSYSRKFNGLFEDTLQYHHIVDLKAIEFDDSMSIIKESFGNRVKIKKEIEFQQKTTVKERKELLYSELSKFFGL